MGWVLATRVVIVVLAVARIALADSPPAEVPPTVAPDDVTITQPVTDIGNHVAPVEREAIAAQLVELRAKTGIQMAVLIVESTAPRSIEQFAQGVFDRWRGGSAERDDGILFVLAIRDRRNRLHFGDGIAGIISEAEAIEILDGLRPLLAAKAYAMATSQAISGVTVRVDHIVPGGPLERKPLPFGVGSGFHALVIAALGIAGAILWHRRRKAGDGRGWYLSRWIVLPAISIGIIAIVGLYRNGPWPGFASLWAASVLFGIVISRIARIGWGAALLWFFVGWIPLGMPVAVLIPFGVSDGTLGFATAAAAQGITLALALGSLPIGGVGLLLTSKAGESGRGGSSYRGYSSSTSYDDSSSASTSSTTSSTTDWSGGGGSSSGGGGSSSW
jgi:uncharacterized protein